MQTKIGKALVIGGGISGIRAALDLAEFGYGVTLIERGPHIGGLLSQLDYQFPTDRCGMCKMLPLVERDAGAQFCLRKGLFHENIDIHLATELASVEGEPGQFKVTLRQESNPVNPDLCIGCGRCVEVCPVDTADCFNAGLSTRKAIYLPVPHVIPNAYRIDTNVCTQCGACQEACPTGAITLMDEGRKDFNILVVDDELIVRDSLKEWLEVEGGFRVSMAESGPEALERIKADACQLMLLDIKMPGMDGVEVLQKAKELFPDLPVVMMTAYATVETAVDAMKIGALDYLIKPFDPDALIPKVIQIYQSLSAPVGPELEVGAIVMSGGTSYYNPAEGKDTYGYGTLPDVVTSIEFERLLSGTGPSAGKLVRPSDGRPITRIAWLQCVGSRDIQNDADFCSNICCMYAIKEAMVARERAARSGATLDTSIYYMDMRTFGKSFQRYRERSEEAGVNFKRGRVHTVVPDQAAEDLQIRWVPTDGTVQVDHVDLVVLSVGQRPAEGAHALLETLGIGENPWGFPATEPFSLTRTARTGIVASGSFAGLKDISESVIQASAAALAASQTIHSAGGGIGLKDDQAPVFEDVSRQLPRILVAVCTCNEDVTQGLDQAALADRLRRDPSVDQVHFLDHTCTAEGWDQLVALIRRHEPNRVLIGACLPYVYARKLKQLGREVSLDPRLIEVVDIRSNLIRPKDAEAPAPAEPPVTVMERVLSMGAARLRHMSMTPVATVPVFQRALVVGGGIAGMTAALSIADHGFEVDLVEQSDQLGGNLHWLHHLIDGEDVGPLLEDTCGKVTQHPRIEVHLSARIVAAFGQAGTFYSTIEDREGQVRQLVHGATILATGGSEATTTAYGFGTSENIITQKTLETQLHDGTLDPTGLKTVVMIQCVDSREEPRNYCSRVCCPTTLKHVRALKAANPNLRIVVFYRDMMSTGFLETYFTQARKSGVTFIPYDLENKPQVALDETDGGRLKVTGHEPFLDRPVAISADRVVLATGIVPSLSPDLAQAYGVERDQDTFFQEAESKWRPVDALKEGVFACGICLSPRNIEESIATAEAAAERALRIVASERVASGSIIARVHESLCALCERCIEACPYNARMLDPEGERILVNPVMCQGCGACAAICPNDAAYVEGFDASQVMDVIDAAIN
ncbi:MAG: FAD-dependent oxidoreductase [Desulfobacterales bacterium]|jgi:heterodisulfide reductase subunit A